MAAEALQAFGLLARLDPLGDDLEAERLGEPDDRPRDPLVPGALRDPLDEFGTGRSSLEQLCRLPFDVVKIARPLVDRIGNGPGDERVTRAIIGLAKSLGLKVVAEGIETREQAERLKRLGCHLGQGFYFDRALAVAQATHRLRTPASGHLRLVEAGADTA